MPFFATPALASLMMRENKALSGHVANLQRDLNTYDSMQLHAALVSLTEEIFKHYNPSVPTMVKLAIHFLSQGSTVSEDSFNGLDSTATTLGLLSDTVEEYYQTGDEEELEHEQVLSVLKCVKRFRKNTWPNLVVKLQCSDCFSKSVFKNPGQARAVPIVKSG